MEFILYLDECSVLEGSNFHLLFLHVLWRFTVAAALQRVQMVFGWLGYQMSMVRCGSTKPDTADPGIPWHEQVLQDIVDER